MEGLTAFCGLTFIPRFQTSVNIVRMCVHYHCVSHRYPVAFATLLSDHFRWKSGGNEVWVWRHKAVLIVTFFLSLYIKLRLSACLFQTIIVELEMWNGSYRLSSITWSVNLKVSHKSYVFCIFSCIHLTYTCPFLLWIFLIKVSMVDLVSYRLIDTEPP